MSRRRQRYSYVDEWKRLWKPDLEAIAYNGNSVDPTKVDPKVLQWAKDNLRASIGVRFVTNLLSWVDYDQHVPNLFVQENFKELERVVTLEHADGRMWRVSFGTSPRKHPRWLQGWERVAKDNHLKPGDVMVCVLERTSLFHFTVFDEDGNMRSTSTINSARAKKEPSHRHQEPSITTPDLEHPKTRKRLFQVADSPSCQENPEAAVCPHKTLNPPVESVDPFAFSIKSRRRVTTALENQRAWDAAMAHANTLSALHFTSVMSETQVYRDFHLVLPDFFVAESSFPTAAARWRLLDCDDNSWDMYSMTNKRNKVTLHRKHWAQFSLHHLLEDGDVCVFELKEDDALAITVHIFRVLPINNARSVHAHYEMREINPT